MPQPLSSGATESSPTGVPTGSSSLPSGAATNSAGLPSGGRGTSSSFSVSSGRTTGVPTGGQGTSFSFPVSSGQPTPSTDATPGNSGSNSKPGTDAGTSFSFPDSSGGSTLSTAPLPSASGPDSNTSFSFPMSSGQTVSTGATPSPSGSNTKPGSGDNTSSSFPVWSGHSVSTGVLISPSGSDNNTSFNFPLSSGQTISTGVPSNPSATNTAPVSENDPISSSFSWSDSRSRGSTSPSSPSAPGSGQAGTTSGLPGSSGSVTHTSIPVSDSGSKPTNDGSSHDRSISQTGPSGAPDTIPASNTQWTGSATFFSFPMGPNRTAEQWSSQTSVPQSSSDGNSLYHESTGLPTRSATGEPGSDVSPHTRPQTNASGEQTGKVTRTSAVSGSDTGTAAEGSGTGTFSSSGGASSSPGNSTAWTVPHPTQLGETSLPSGSRGTSFSFPTGNSTVPAGGTGAPSNSGSTSFSFPTESGTVPHGGTGLPSGSGATSFSFPTGTGSVQHGGTDVPSDPEPSFSFPTSPQGGSSTSPGVSNTATGEVPSSAPFPTGNGTSRPVTAPGTALPSGSSIETADWSVGTGKGSTFSKSISATLPGHSSTGLWSNSTHPTSTGSWETGVSSSVEAPSGSIVPSNSGPGPSSFSGTETGHGTSSTLSPGVSTTRIPGTMTAPWSGGTGTGTTPSQGSPWYTKSSIPTVTGTGAAPSDSGLLSSSTCDEEYSSFPGSEAGGPPGTEASVTGQPTAPGNESAETTCTEEEERTTASTSCSESGFPGQPTDSGMGNSGYITVSTPPFGGNTTSLTDSKPLSPNTPTPSRSSSHASNLRFLYHFLNRHSPRVRRFLCKRRPRSRRGRQQGCRSHEPEYAVRDRQPNPPASGHRRLWTQGFWSGRFGAVQEESVVGGIHVDQGRSLRLGTR
ncbi:hypothetical protein VUR80DRAFT_5379 [Thermomyces stellatus]